MSHEDASWYARGEANGYADTKAGRRYRVAAEGPCASYAKGYAAGVTKAAQE